MGYEVEYELCGKSIDLHRQEQYSSLVMSGMWTIGEKREPYRFVTLICNECEESLRLWMRDRQTEKDQNRD